jgi:hypothetical protein
VCAFENPALWGPTVVYTPTLWGPGALWGPHLKSSQCTLYNFCLNVYYMPWPDPWRVFVKVPKVPDFHEIIHSLLHTLAGIPSVFVFGAYTRGVMRMRVLSTHAPNAVRAPFCWTETGWRIPTGKYVCGKKTPFSTYFSKPIATRQRRAETSEVTNLTKSERGCREGISAPPKWSPVSTQSGCHSVSVE